MNKFTKAMLFPPALIGSAIKEKVAEIEEKAVARSTGSAQPSPKPRSFRLERGGGPKPKVAPGPVTCVRTYRTAGQYKRGVEQMAREGWCVVSQSSSTPRTYKSGGFLTPKTEVGFTKTLVTFERVPLSVTPTDAKSCPDCAEEVKAAANVCRFCGYRFDAVT